MRVGFRLVNVASYERSARNVLERHRRATEKQLFIIHLSATRDPLYRLFGPTLAA